MHINSKIFSSIFFQDDDVVAETNRVHAIEQFTDEEVVVIKDLGKVGL